MGSSVRLVAFLLALCLVPWMASAQSPTAAAVLSSATCPGTGCVVLGVTGIGGAAIQVTGTWSGTLQFEASVDGITYVAVNMTPSNDTTAVTSSTGNGVWIGGIGGLRVVRVRFSSYASGTAAVTIQGAPTSR